MSAVGRPLRRPLPLCRAACRSLPRLQRRHSSGAATARVGFRGAIIAAGSAVAAAIAGGGFVSRFAIWSPTDVTAGTDGSRASLDVSRQAKEVVQVTYTEVDGSRRVASLDRELFDEVACRQVAALNEARGGLKERAAKALALEVDAVLSDLHGADRVRKFADWYYGYSTAYELLRVGIVAAAASLPSSLSAREEG
mmetsp:Transcript_25192/g.84952  ORF Transcript_25192/g.84952 Transcript_25192/m.84952 type:complete len:196 (+) Transcript_25192:16-603(+)